MNIIVKSTSLHDFCRVCLKSSIQLVPCRTKLFYRDTSLTIIDILNIISPQNMGDPTYYPINICFACKEFVQTTFILKTTYERTNEVLKTLFAGVEKKQQEEKSAIIKVEDGSTEDNEGTKYVYYTKRNCNDITNDQRESFINNTDYETLHISVIKDDDDEDIKELYCEESISESENNLKAINEKWINNPLFEKENYGKERISTNEDSEELYLEEEFDYNTNVLNEKLVNNLFPKKMDNIKRTNLKTKKLQKRSTKNRKKITSTEAKQSVEGVKISTNRTSMKLEGKPLVEQHYLCPICKKELSNPMELLQHASIHKIVKKYLHPFLKIPRKTKFFAQPRENITIFSKNKILHKCTFCKEENSIDNFRIHIKDHFKRGDFACNQCDRVFRKLGHLNAHKTIVHMEELPYQCNECDKGFTAQYSYECHMLAHKNSPEELPHKCDYCGKAYANKHLLKRHLFRHTAQKSYWSVYKINKCKICLRTFETFDELQVHRSSKCEPVPISLKRLPKKYWTDQGLPEPPVSKELCSLCGASVINIKQHMKNKHEAKNAVKELCDICGASVLNMKQHMGSHQPKKFQECNICHKKLSSKLTLVKHIRVHTGERPYPCKYCEKRFKDPHTKSVHERTHEGIRRHFCPVCGKGFLEKAYMLKHLRGVHK